MPTRTAHCLQDNANTQKDETNCARGHARTREETMKSKLPRDILSLVNRKSHALGISYAEQTKQQLLDELESMRAKGATLADLEKYIGNRPPPIFTA